MTDLRPARRVLVMRFSSLGDILLTTPALAALERAWPQCELVYATSAGFADLVRWHPAVRQVVAREPQESWGTFFARLRSLDCDAVLDLHGKPRTRLMAMRLPARRRVTWHKRPMLDSVLVGLRLRRYHAALPIADRHHAAVERLVGRELPRGEMFLGLDPEAVRRADALLVAHGVTLDRPLVGMSPGALWATKRWPVERFGQLAARALTAGAQVVLTGSAAEAPLTASARAVAPGAVDLAGKLGLAELGAVIARCQAFVANDSGPMHMARALGVPTVAFFGSTDPKQFHFDGHALMFAGADCSPCSLHGLVRCPRRHLRCLLDLPVDAAWSALEGLLRERRAVRVSG